MAANPASSDGCDAVRNTRFGEFILFKYCGDSLSTWYTTLMSRFPCTLPPPPRPVVTCASRIYSVVYIVYLAPRPTPTNRSQTSYVQCKIMAHGSASVMSIMGFLRL